MTKLTEKFIAEAIQEFQKSQESHPTMPSSLFHNVKLRQSAVMIPLFENEGNWHVLLTNRSNNLVEHRGQVAFPGGAKDREDQDLQETALREMYEEVGILPEKVRVYGHLGEIKIVTGYIVSLFVGKVPWPYDLRINPDEVESTFTVPLKWLANPQHRTIEYRRYAGREIPVIFFDDYEGHQLWGASADMTMILLDALGLSHGFVQ